MDGLNLDGFTMQDLRAMQASIRDEMNELDGQFQRCELIEQHYWSVMDEKVIQYGQVMEAMKILTSVTYGEAKSLKEWVK